MAGYKGYSKSNNAVAAENAGLVVRSKITKAWLAAGGIDESPAFIKWLAGKDLIAADEWHHTSKFYNEVDYFSVEGVAEELARVERYGNLDQLRVIYANKEARKLDGRSIIDLASYLAGQTNFISEAHAKRIASIAKDLNLI